MGTKRSKPKAKQPKSRKATSHVLCKAPRGLGYTLAPTNRWRITSRRYRIVTAFAFIATIGPDSALATVPDCTCPTGKCPVIQRVMTQVDKLGIETCTYNYVKPVKP